MATPTQSERLEQLGISKGKSLEDIASLMAQNREQMIESGKYPSAKARQPVLPNEVDDDDTTDEDDNLETDEGEIEEEDDDDAGASLEDDEDDDEGATGEEEDDDDEGGNEEYELSDEDLIEIEGLDEPVTFKQLKDVYQADKTVAEKVEQTEAARLEASQTLAKAQEESQKFQDAMQAMVGGIEQLLAQPLISKPDEKLKTTDPARYIQHLEAYNQDQQRINDSRSTFLSALEEHAKSVKETHQSRREHELGLLTQKLPALRSEETKTQASRDILTAAEYFGFAPEEVNNSADHRIFMMAYYAQQYLKLKGLSKEEKENKVTTIKTKIASQPKIMRSKGTAKSRLNSAQKRVKVIKSKAQKSGRPEDVASFMAANRQVRS